jgi:chemotaxis protein histidine kinase CheA
MDTVLAQKSRARKQQQDHAEQAKGEHGADERPEGAAAGMPLYLQGGQAPLAPVPMAAPSPGIATTAANPAELSSQHGGNGRGNGTNPAATGEPGEIAPSGMPPPVAVAPTSAANGANGFSTPSAVHAVTPGGPPAPNASGTQELTRPPALPAAADKKQGTTKAAASAQAPGTSITPTPALPGSSGGLKPAANGPSAAGSEAASASSTPADTATAAPAAPTPAAAAPSAPGAVAALGTPEALAQPAATAAPATALAGEAAAGGGGQGAPSSGGDAGDGGSAAAESAPADSAEAAEQEKTEEKMEGAAPEAAQEDAAADEEGTPDAAAETSVSGGDAETTSGESGGAEAAEAPQPEAAAAAAESAPPEQDPDAAQRKEDAQQARQEQADSQRVAEQGSEEHAEDQAEQQADSGGAPAGGEAELSSSEKDAGLNSLAESPEGGGGEAAPGSAVGGGGGGAPVPEPEPAPDTAGQDPASGLGAAAGLQPLQAGMALQGVGASIDTTAQEEGASLQEQMPPVDVGGDGSGGSAVVAAPEGTAPPALAEAPAAQAQPTPAPVPLPEPGPAPTEAIARPRIADTAEGTVSREDATRVATSVSSMPTTDPGLSASAGPPPQLAKLGDADPAQIHSQQSELDSTIAAQKTRGDADAAAPAGENDVRDRSPRQTLQAPRLTSPGAGGAGGAAPADDEAVGIIAEQKQGGEVRAAMAQAQGAMAEKRSEHQVKVSEEKAKSNAEIAALQQENATQQQAEKGKVQTEVGKARSDWTAEQNAEVSSTNKKAQAEIGKGNEKISKEEQQANEKAEAHISAGEAEAAEHKQQAEKEAAAKKAEAERQKEEESGGIFGWIASKVSAFFDALKSAITKVFDAARKLVKAAIDKAKQLAVAVIETARKAVVGLIKAVGAALIALGDVLLAAFPGLKKKWRSFIESKVKAAENAVNRLADALKQGVTKLLDALGKAFDFLLDAYKKAMLAVLDVAKGVVIGAIKAAKAIADFIGTFVVLIKDIAKAPGQWISNLGAAVLDGVRNHLWKAFKTAVKGWFDSKLEEVLGVGTTIWNVLKQGGISLKQVGQMAFEALKAAIPSALIQLLIEKLVAMIVPVAGAVMAIIEGLQAAWPAVQRIIAAVGLFVVFLKAVKAGGAGPQFATMLAAGAVVVIDFVANWLLKKLRGPASKVGSKVKAIAQKIMARVKKALSKVGKALKKVGAKIKGKAKGLKQKFDAWKAKRKAKKDAKKKEDPSKKKQDKEKANQERLRKAVEAIRPQIEGMSSRRGLKGLILRTRLLGWQLRYRLTSLRIRKAGRSFAVEAKVNPVQDVITGWVEKNLPELRKMIHEIASELMATPEAQAVFDSIKDTNPTQKANALRTSEEGFDGAGQALALAARQRGTKPHAPHFDALTPNHAPARGSNLAITPAKGGEPVRVTQSGNPSAQGRPGSALFRDANDAGKTYPEFAADGKALNKAGISDQQMASQATAILRGEAPGGPLASQSHAASAAVMVGVEGGRSDRALIMMPEMLHTAAEGKNLAHLEGTAAGNAPMSMEQALVHHNPASPEGAAKAMAVADAKSGGATQKPYKSEQIRGSKQQAAERHLTAADIAYFAHVTALKISGGGSLIGKSDSEIVAALQQRNIMSELREFIKQRASKAHGLDRHPDADDPRGRDD